MTDLGEPEIIRRLRRFAQIFKEGAEGKMGEIRAKRSQFRKGFQVGSGKGTEGSAASGGSVQFAKKRLAASLRTRLCRTKQSQFWRVASWKWQVSRGQGLRGFLLHTSNSRRAKQSQFPAGPGGTGFGGRGPFVQTNPIGVAAGTNKTNPLADAGVTRANQEIGGPGSQFGAPGARPEADCAKQGQFPLGRHER